MPTELFARETFVSCMVGHPQREGGLGRRGAQGKRRPRQAKSGTWAGLSQPGQVAKGGSCCAVQDPLGSGRKGWRIGSPGRGSSSLLASPRGFSMEFLVCWGGRGADRASQQVSKQRESAKGAAALGATCFAATSGQRPRSLRGRLRAQGSPPFSTPP